MKLDNQGNSVNLSDAKLMSPEDYKYLANLVNQKNEVFEKIGYLQYQISQLTKLIDEFNEEQANLEKQFQVKYDIPPGSIYEVDPRTLQIILESEKKQREIKVGSNINTDEKKDGKKITAPKGKGKSKT